MPWFALKWERKTSLWCEDALEMGVGFLPLFQKWNTWRAVQDRLTLGWEHFQLYLLSADTTAIPTPWKVFAPPAARNENTAFHTSFHSLCRKTGIFWASGSGTGCAVCNVWIALLWFLGNFFNLGRRKSSPFPTLSEFWACSFECFTAFLPQCLSVCVYLVYCCFFCIHSFHCQFKLNVIKIALVCST